MSYNPNLDCVHNAYNALQHLRKEGKDGKVIFVFNPSHAYLLTAGRVLNRGITFGDGSYPDFSTKEIITMLKNGNAEDITSSLDHSYASEGELPYSVGGRNYRLNNRF